MNRHIPCSQLQIDFSLLRGFFPNYHNGMYFLNKLHRFFFRVTNRVRPFSYIQFNLKPKSVSLVLLNLITNFHKLIKVYPQINLRFINFGFHSTKSHP